jgi:hypothetical protein
VIPHQRAEDDLAGRAPHRDAWGSALSKRARERAERRSLIDSMERHGAANDRVARGHRHGDRVGADGRCDEGLEHDLRADVVVVPHHGSRTSSSPGFVQAVAPRVALIGSGHGNRFGLPRGEVVRRWRAAGAQVLQTADRGAITLRPAANGMQPPQSRRETRPRWWRED